MKIGLYFGSFNPVHIGHLIIASHVLNETDLERVWFGVSPQNPFKEEKNLLNEYHRLNLVRVAIEDDNRMRASDIEFGLPRPSYTSSTLAYLVEKYPEHQFCILMGSDSFQNLQKWKNPEYITENFPIYVYKRPGFEMKEPVAGKVQVLEAPLLQISATHIRECLRSGKSARYLLPERVLHEIERSHYYR